MKNWSHYCRPIGWRLVVAGILATGAAPVRADDWGNWPVPWPPPGSTNPPAGGPAGSGVTPPPANGQPPGSPPPAIDSPPPGSSQPPTGAEPPPLVPLPGVPLGPPVPIPPATPEPASAVMGLCGVGAGVLAWRRKRAK
jgi:hypothetical protein